MKKERIQTYQEFWPYYLSEHSHASTRWIHLIGTMTAIGLLGYLVATGCYRWIPLTLIVGYGPAWFSHFFIEKNRPATFQYPYWSFISDFRMAYFLITRKL